jgi:hypothetical protein
VTPYVRMGMLLGVLDAILYLLVVGGPR